MLHTVISLEQLKTEFLPTIVFLYKTEYLPRTVFLPTRSGKAYSCNRKVLIRISFWDTSAGHFIKCDVS